MIPHVPEQVAPLPPKTTSSAEKKWLCRSPPWFLQCLLLLLRLPPPPFFPGENVEARGPRLRGGADGEALDGSPDFPSKSLCVSLSVAQKKHPAKVITSWGDEKWTSGENQKERSAWGN